MDGKPAPDFDTFIWGWGGDPYDPSFLLSILTTGEIGGSSDSFFSNAEYDKLYKEQLGVFDTDARREIIQRMVAITQDELPYLVLTEDPVLQAYRTDRIESIAPICPAETGDLFCDSVSPLGVLAAFWKGGGQNRRALQPPRPGCALYGVVDAHDDQGSAARICAQARSADHRLLRRRLRRCRRPDRPRGTAASQD